MRSPSKDHNQRPAKKREHEKEHQQLRRPRALTRAVVARFETNIKSYPEGFNPADQPWWQTEK